MRLPAVACLAWLLILAQGLGVAAQDATKKADAKKADVKKADVKKAGVKKADVKKADVKKAGEADSKKESGAEAKTQPPGTESAPEDTSRGWFSNMIHSGATGLLIDGGWFMVPILLKN